jgi:hypothetical protein
MESEVYPHKIKAIVNRPNSGVVMKGEIGIYRGISNKYDFPSQQNYSVTHSLIGIKYEIVEDNPQYEIY